MSAGADAVTPRAEVLAALARRYRDRYADRLAGVYAAPSDPYAPERSLGDPGLHVTVVLVGPYDHWQETDAVSRIAHEVMEETGWQVSIVPHHVSHESALARRVQAQGVRLD